MQSYTRITISILLFVVFCCDRLNAHEILGEDFRDMFIEATFHSNTRREEVIKFICDAQYLLSQTKAPLTDRGISLLADGDWGCFPLESPRVYHIFTGKYKFPRAFIEITPDSILIQEGISWKHYYENAKEPGKKQLAIIDSKMKEIEAAALSENASGDRLQLLEDLRNQRDYLKNALTNPPMTQNSIGELKDDIEGHIKRWKRHYRKWTLSAEN